MISPHHDLDVAGLVQKDRIDSEIYRDQAVFELEMKRIFQVSWVYAAHASEVAEPGDYKASYLGLQPVIVNRSATTGEIQVLLNRCRHRGAMVCESEHGCANYFRCPYHGWTYDSGGRLVGVPYRQGYGPDFDLQRLSLSRVPRVAMYGGFIFASLVEEGPSLEEHLGNAKPYLTAIECQSTSGRVVVGRGRNRYEYAGNWKLQQENVTDNYHLNVVHRAWNELLRERGTPDAGSDGPGYRNRDLGNGHGCLDFRDDTGAPSLPGELGFNLQVFPNLSFVGIQIRVTQPLAAERTLVTLYPTLIEGASGAENEQRIRRHEDFFGPAGFGTPDDVEVVMRRVPLGIAATAGDRSILFNRGLDRESVDANGVRSCHITDEASQRSFYRAWRDHMAGERSSTTSEVTPAAIPRS